MSQREHGDLFVSQGYSNSAIMERMEQMSVKYCLVGKRWSYVCFGSMRFLTTNNIESGKFWGMEGSIGRLH